jgi:5'-3' exonuclease
MILIDGSSLTYKIYHGNKKEIINEDNTFNKDYFKHLLLSSMIWRTKSLGASIHNRVVVCSDSKPYWRTEYFDSVKEEYFKDYYLTEKAKKDIDIENYKYKGKREKDEFAKQVWEVHTEVIEFVKTMTDFIELKVDKAEADDIIAVLAKHISKTKNEEVFIVAGDKDFKQLLSDQNIHFYNDNPFKKKGSSDFIEEEDPVKFLETHIMVGDASDNIPNIKPKIGDVTALKLYNNKELFEELLNANPSIVFRYQVNRKMIDFNHIPMDIQENILNAYNRAESGKFDDMKMIEYFLENRLYDLQSRRQEFSLSNFKKETNLNTYFKRKRSDDKYLKNIQTTLLEDCF